MGRRDTLSPTEKWRVEVDYNYLETLRLANGLRKIDLERAGVVNRMTYKRIQLQGHASLVTIASLATFYHILPGELIVWFAVPKSEPDRPAVGKGRVIPKRRKPGLPRRALKHWAAGEDATLHRLRSVGLSWQHIATIMARSKRAVVNRWKEIKDGTQPVT